MNRHALWTAPIVLTLLIAGTSWAGPPTQFLDGQVKAVRALLAKPVVKDTPEKAKIDGELRAILDPVMDFDRLSQNALRKHWDGLKPPQRSEFILIFRALVFHTYMEKIRSAGEQYTIEYEDEMPKGRKAATVAALAKTKRAEIELVFHLIAQSPTKWVAEDIVIDEVSVVENYREQFNKIILKDGFDALLEKMRAKLKDLGGTIDAGQPATPATEAASDAKKK